MENSSDFNKILSNPSYSRNSKSQASSLLQVSDPKKRYATVIQQQKQNQRKQLHKKLQRQKEEEDKLYRKHLKGQINKRKKELEKLQHLKETGAEQYKKAAHQAEIKKQKDGIKKLQQSIKTKLANEKANKRYKQAVEKQKLIDQETYRKQIQAKNLRKTHLKTEVIERQTAVKHSRSLKQRQTRQKEQKRKVQEQEFQLFKKGLKVNGLTHRTLNQHQFATFVVKENQQQYNAIDEAIKESLRNSQKQKLRQQALQRNRKTAQSRGNAVLQKMQRQRQYEKYCKQAEEQQKRFNLRRLEAGKRNQYAGVKPLTLSQIEINKKIRSQRQFQKIFMDNPVPSSNEPANRYKIVQTKLIDIVPSAKKQEKWVKRPINYGDNESLIPGVSQGHYSFEEQAEVEEQRPIKVNKNKQAKAMKQTGIADRQQPLKNKLKQTKLPNQAFKQQLDYSDSEQDSNI